MTSTLPARMAGEPPPQLVARAAGGDQQAFAEIYSRCAPGLHRYVRTIVWDAWDAEDVTQEVFVKIYRGLPRYDASRASFSAWMLRVARNAAIDHLRRRQARPSVESAGDHEAVDESGRSCFESLRDAIGDLSSSQQAILMLRALGGFTPPEVADQTDTTTGSINTLYHRARIAARDNLLAMGVAPCTQTRRGGPEEHQSGGGIQCPRTRRPGIGCRE